MSPVRTVAYSPCHITGFFRIHRQYRDITKTGSTGAGVCLQKGVVTAVYLSRASRPRVMIELNGEPLRGPTVSEYVVQHYLKQGHEARRVKVSHLSQLPVGAGYGTSGAGALGLSLALNEALGSPVNKIEAARIAHTAEVRCRTGLGTVAAVFHGGFVVRLKPGAPGTGKVRKLVFSKSNRLVSVSFGPIYTASILSRRSLRTRVNLCGKDLMSRLLRQPEMDAFLLLSRRFADRLGLMSPRLRRFVGMMDSAGICFSMMMIGEGAFSVVHEDRVVSVGRLARRAGLVPVVSRISSKGAHLL